jgi:hypothetical protein
MVEEQREKLALSIRRSGELAKLMAEEKAREEKVRQELESLTFRDPDSQVGNLSNKEYCQVLIIITQVVEGSPGLELPSMDGAWGGAVAGQAELQAESDSGFEMSEL